MHDLLNNVFPNVLDGQTFLRVSIRLAVAILLGGAVGFEREKEGKSAGVRTHMMVALGAALFALVSLESNNDPNALSRVIQGVAAGIGFLGAGAIIKKGNEREVKGLTTAGGIWVTAAVGLAVGVGLIWPAVVGVVMAWAVLGVFHVLERWWEHPREQQSHGDGQGNANPPPPS